MTFSLKLAVLGVLLMLPGGTAIAAAANGVVQPGAHTTVGWVVGVQHGNGQGTFRIRTTNTNNLRGAAANVGGIAAAAPSVQRFTVGPATRFAIVGPTTQLAAVQGANPMLASFASLRAGQRVRVQAQGQQAISVQILGGNPSGAMRRPRYATTLRRSPRVFSGARTSRPMIMAQPTANLGHPTRAPLIRNASNVRVTPTAKHVTPRKR